MANLANGFGEQHSRRKSGAMAMEGMSFLEPVRVGDTVACYAWVERIGRTSMVIPVEVWVRRYMHGKQIRVTHGVFTHVAVDDSGKPIPVKRETA